MSNIQQRLIVGGILPLAMVLAACGDSTTVTPLPTPSPSAVASPVPSPIPTPSGKTFMLTGLGTNATVHGTITITEETGSFTVVLDVTGLAASSVHPAHIHKGSICTANGMIDLSLKDVTADTSGHGTSTTTFTQAYVVPATGWYINVHQGPTLAGAGATPITCGVIS